jgi:heat shock protein HtpX
MWEQIRANRIRSVILVIGMAALLLVIGYFLGLYFFGSGTGGVIIAFIVWGILNLVAFFQGAVYCWGCRTPERLNGTIIPASTIL